MIDFGLGNGWLALVGAVLVAVMLAVPLGRVYARRLKRLVAFCRGIPLFCRIAFAAVFATLGLYSSIKTNDLTSSSFPMPPDIPGYVRPLPLAQTNTLSLVETPPLREGPVFSPMQNPPSLLAAGRAPLPAASHAERIARRWHLHGAWNDSFWFSFGGGFVFPEGTNHLTGVEVLARGELWRTPFDASPVASLGAAVSIVSNVTEFSCFMTPSNSCRFTWHDAFVGRVDAEEIANGVAVPIDAAMELFRNGDVLVETNGVSTLIPRTLPFPNDGFGQDGEWVAANFTNAAEIAAAGGYAAWVDAQVGTDLTNGLYKLTVSLADDPPETTFLSVGDLSVAVTNSGEYVFLLGKGSRYAINFSFLPDSVLYSWNDGIESSFAQDSTGYDMANNLDYSIRISSIGDDGNGVDFVEPRQDGEGFVIWWPWLSIVPKEECNPVFPVLLSAEVFDIPMEIIPSVSWMTNGCVIATGPTFLLNGTEEGCDTINVIATVRDVELHGSVCVERRIVHSSIALNCGGLIVVEDAYTNSPNDIVSATSSSATLNLSWALTENGTFGLDSSCTSVAVVDSELEDMVPLPFEWRGFAGEAGHRDLVVTGSGTGESGVFTFTFIPDTENFQLVRTASVQVVRMSIEAEADWPSNKVRHVFGPKERFSIMTNPQMEVLVGDNSYAMANGAVVTAPDRPGAFTVSISSGGCSHDILLNCIAPTKVKGGNPRNLYAHEWHAFVGAPLAVGEAGVVMHIDTWLEPSYVSFRHLRLFEGFAPTSNRTGWYQDLARFPEGFLCHNADAGAGTATQSVGIAGNGNFTENGDYVGTWIGACPAYTNGSYQLAIPLRWFAEGGLTTNDLPANIQTAWVYTNGTMRIEKNEVIWERTLNGVSYQVTE